ncbi:hypothetical protein [Candidatus Phytoplasma palmae]|uniref:hypothetical protein n=1 Tax=Candidatus Phytoplasma palmae TaxID=85624 RepID=UPI003990C2AC
MIDLSVFWIQIRTFTAFFIGLFCGFLLFSLMYLFFIIKNFNKTFHQLKVKNNKLTNEQMNEFIIKAQQKFKKDIKKDKNDYIFSLWRNIHELTYKISSSFFPDSEFPYLELTIDESLVLIKYLHHRIEELFQKRIIFVFKKMTLRRIFTLKKQLVDKKYIDNFKKTNKCINLVSNTLNLFNPFHWTKKIFFNTFYETIISKIGCSIIVITGEEVYKIYSKTLFTADQNLNKILATLEKEILKKNKKKK